MYRMFKIYKKAIIGDYRVGYKIWNGTNLEAYPVVQLQSTFLGFQYWKTIFKDSGNTRCKDFVNKHMNARQMYEWYTDAIKHYNDIRQEEHDRKMSFEKFDKCKFED